MWGFLMCLSRAFNDFKLFALTTCKFIFKYKNVYALRLVMCRLVINNCCVPEIVCY